MRDILIRICASAGLSVRREPKRLLPGEPEIRPGDLVMCDWNIDGIQQTTHALDFTAPVPHGGWRGPSRAKKEARSLTVGVRSIERSRGNAITRGSPRPKLRGEHLYHARTLP
jgi:hypothetical protein